MLNQDAERCINWYPELDKNPNAKTVIALLGTPGLNPVMTTKAGEVRGMWVLPGGLTALIVTGNTLYLATVIVPATQTAIAQFSVVSVGTLLTSIGPVCIRDNGVVFGGAGGYAVIVDGQYGYYYRIGGGSTLAFSGTVTAGSTVITPTGQINADLVPGSGLSDTFGAIQPGTTIVSLDFNVNTITMSAPATASPGAESITVTNLKFGKIVDPAFLGADHVAFIEGWLIFNQPGTRTFYTNAPIPYTLAFAGSFYALKDSSSDNLVALFENSRELWLIGERTTEVWYNAGNPNFAFARLPGVGPQIGCSAKNSVARLGTSLVWLGRNEQGENIVVATNQYSWERISTHAIEAAIASYPVIDDALAYAYEAQGHLFYVLTFPTADTTWVFDATTQLWHQRLSWNAQTGDYHRHRSNCFCNFSDLRLVGDYQTGKVHQLSRKVYTDDGQPLICQRRTPHVWSRENRKRVFQSAIQVEFRAGQSLPGGDYKAMLRWSNDAGQTWSNEHWRDIGKIGATLRRAIWRRLGKARDRVYELNFDAPVPRDVVGATLFGEGEEETGEAA